MHPPDPNQPRRKIVSYVRRQGRMTSGQQRAYDNHWPSLGIELNDHNKPLDLANIYRRQAPKILEIGFGMGQSLAQMAMQNRDNDYLGVEVHRPGVGALLLLAEQHQLTNLRIVCDDAVRLIRDHLADNALDGIQIYFPDPWHKKRHNKRRLIQPDFIQLLLPKLRPGGHLHCATDWQPYAEQMLAVLNAQSELKNRATDNRYSPRPDHRPQTKFETRGQRLGHGVWDLIYDKRPTTKC